MLNIVDHAKCSFKFVSYKKPNILIDYLLPILPCLKFMWNMCIFTNINTLRLYTGSMVQLVS